MKKQTDICNCVMAINVAKFCTWFKIVMCAVMLARTFQLEEAILAINWKK